jgi:hypothetical protein
MIPPPASISPQALADWVELSCMKAKRARVSQSDVLDQLRDYGIDGAEDLCATTWQELQRRADALRVLYPFSVAASHIRQLGPLQGHVVYAMLLLLAGSEVSRPQQPARLFEELATLGIERYTGGKALRIGHPRVSPVPSSFAKLLAYLSRELGERLLRDKPLNPATKDCRADIIAWRPFADGRSGQLIVLAQCAIGSAWTKKLTECNVGVWQLYLDFVVAPVRAFAIPFVAPNEDLWLEHGRMGGIAFDRLRLVEQLAKCALPAKLETGIRTWAKAQMKGLAWDE